MRSLFNFVFAVFALAACGGSQPAKPVATTTTPTSVSMRETTHGSEMPDVHTAARGDLAVTVIAPQRTGEILKPRIVPLTIEVMNRRDHPVSIHPAFVELEVFGGQDPVAICSLRKPLALPLVLQGMQTLNARAVVPCALPNAGTYSINATVVVGEPDMSAVLGPDEVVHSASTRIVVDAELAAVGSETMPVARVNPETFAFPSQTNADVTSKPGPV